MYGVINAIEGLDAFNDLMKNTNIGPWYTRMKKQVNSHAGATQPDWLVGEVEAWISNGKKASQLEICDALPFGMRVKWRE